MAKVNAVRRVMQSPELKSRNLTGEKNKPVLNSIMFNFKKHQSIFTEIIYSIASILRYCISGLCTFRSPLKIADYKRISVRELSVLDVLSDLESGIKNKSFEEISEEGLCIKGDSHYPDLSRTSSFDLILIREKSFYEIRLVEKTKSGKIFTEESLLKFTNQEEFNNLKENLPLMLNNYDTKYNVIFPTTGEGRSACFGEEERSPCLGEEERSPCLGEEERSPCLGEEERSPWFRSDI